GIAVEEAAEVGLELADALRRSLDQQPGQVLIVEPAAAFDRVHEMALDRIVRRQRDVVAALHHARAAAFAEQALDRDGDVEIGVGLLGVQRREQPGAAGAEDEDVGFERVHAAPMLASTAARRAAASALTCACSELPCESIVTSSGPKPLMRNFHSDSGCRSSRSTSSIASIQVVSSAAAPPTMAKYAPPMSRKASSVPCPMPPLPMMRRTPSRSINGRVKRSIRIDVVVPMHKGS